jgi:hypothetical protein
MIPVHLDFDVAKQRTFVTVLLSLWVILGHQPTRTMPKASQSRRSSLSLLGLRAKHHSHPVHHSVNISQDGLYFRTLSVGK